MFAAAYPMQSPPSGAVLPYSGSNASLGREVSPGGGRERTMSSGSSSEQLQHKAPHTSYENNSPQTEFPTFFHSSPTMEGPISFVAPELAEEILMDVSCVDGVLVIQHECHLYELAT